MGYVVVPPTTGVEESRLCRVAIEAVLARLDVEAHSLPLPHSGRGSKVFHLLLRLCGSEAMKI